MIPGCDISSLLDENLSGGQLHPELQRWHVGRLSQTKQKNQQSLAEISR